MYRHEGWYILMCAEGGTSVQHSEVVLRARSPWGPFQPYAGNPILTQRDLPVDRADPIVNAGHADLVEGVDGHWWAIFLASRPYEQVHYNTGRETYLLPVTWRDGWPLILARGKEIPYMEAAPTAPAALNARDVAHSAPPYGHQQRETSPGEMTSLLPRCAQNGYRSESQGSPGPTSAHARAG